MSPHFSIFSQVKIIINTIALLVFLAQFIFFVLGALNQKKPENVVETLHSWFIISAYLCSLLTVFIFVIQYNFGYKFFKNKVYNCISLVIVVLGLYIHLSQLLTLNGFMLVSIILLFMDYYIIRIILGRIL